MYKKIIVLIIALSLSSLVWAANDQPVSASGLNLLSFDEHHSRLQSVDPDYNLNQVTYADQSYDHLVTDFEGQLRIVGAPELPSVSTMLAVPAEGEIQADYTYTSFHTESNVNLVPLQPTQLELEEYGYDFQRDEEIYGTDAWFPQNPVIVHERVVMRDLHLVTIEVVPFQYNPVSKELRIYEGLQVDVSHTEPLLPPEEPISRFFEPIYKSLVPNSTLVLEPNYQTPCVLYIHPNNTTVQFLVNGLADWRHEKGFETHVVSTTLTGTSNSAIKSYIQTAYNTWANPPEFVVLVGDAGGSFSIPTWTESWSGYSGEGDHPYAHLEGGDYVSDVFVGRLPYGTTSELTNIVSKLVNYEKIPDQSDPSWFNRALVVGDQSSSGLSTIMVSKYIKELVEYRGFQNTIEVYSSFVNGIANGINTGVSYFNYRGYIGMSGWGNTDTQNLTNGNKLPFVTILTCGTGGFTGDCRSEKFLKVGTQTNPKGAIGAVGTATSGTHTLYNNCVDMGIYHGMFSDNLGYAGMAVERGRLNLNATYPSNPSNYVNIFSHWNNLMGDPTTELWTGVPMDIIVDVPTEIPASSDFLELQVNDVFGFGMEGVWATLTGSGVFVSTYSDENGLAVLDLPEDLPSDMTLTLTKHNHIPEQLTIDVDDANYPVQIDAVALTEFNGNGDGMLSPGDMAKIEWTFSNHSDAAASDVSIDVLGEDGTSYSLDYASLAAGESISITADSYLLGIDGDFPSVGRYDVSFTVEANGVSFTDHRRFDVFAPFFQISELDEPGAGAASFDPGEISDLIIELENIGNLASSNLHGELRCNDENIELLDAEAVFSDAAAGAIASNAASPFQVNISTQTTVGVQIPFNLDLIDDVTGEIFETISFLLPVGTAGPGDPTGPDAGGYFCYSDQDLAYALAPEYDWIEIVPSLGGSGTLVPLNDNGPNQEDMETVSLPFQFGFYGLDYDEISIGSNGYIALGEKESALFRNYPIPGPCGPSPMIAPFWDNLVMGSGDVYTWYNATEHYFVIEYHNMVNDYSDSIEKFQVILYDGDYYGSTDGNGDIKFQYHTYNNDNDVGVGWGSSAHGQYSTTGLEDHTGQVGLQYTYNNSWAPTAHVLTDGSALLFTTRTDAVLPCPGWARGDINHDGHRNIQDLIVLVNALLGEITVGDCEFWAADMSMDSTLTVGDVVQLVDVVLGTTLARPSTDTPAQADFIIESGSVILRSSSPAEAFALTVDSKHVPTLVSHDGLTMVSRDMGTETRIVGYWMGSDAPQDFEILRFPDNAINIHSTQAADGAGNLMKTGVRLVPESFSVTSVYPNPFNPSVNISYALPQTGEVNIQIFNALGQEVVNETTTHAAGENTYTWNGLNAQNQQASSGVYFARISAGNSQELIKLTLLR